MVTSASDRRQYIVSQAENDGKITITQLHNQFGVSEVTLRRDLDILESQGLIRRVRGGAAPCTSGTVETKLREKLNLNTMEKKEIAVKAASLIKDGQVVLLGSGTTTTYLARELVKKRDITLITPAVNIAAEVAGYSNISLITIGGVVAPGSYCGTGHFAEEALQSMNADVAFISVDGVDVRGGFTCQNFMYQRISTRMLKAASESYVLADTSKFGVVTLAPVARLEEPTGLITNHDVSEKFLQALKENNCRVIY